MVISESTRNLLQKVVWVVLHTAILGSFVIAYTNIILTIETQSNLYLAIGGFTALMVLYVLGVILVDRISRQIEELANTVESIGDSVENISESLPEDGSSNSE